MTANLQGRTILMSGGSRGIGLAIAERAARDGANVAIVAKTDTPHPKLEGTIHTAAAAIEAAGGRALPILGDVRSEESVQEAVDRTVERFGGIDIVVNNASAIDLSPTEELPMKKYDLMQDINCRGSFLLAKTALPQLKASEAAHVLTLSPPINLAPRWAGSHLGYTIAKYGMSLVTLGLAEEWATYGIAANSLWPRTAIATAAVENLLGGEQTMARSRSPQIMADAAHAILTRDPAEFTGHFLIDDDVLAEEGVTDLSSYGPPLEELLPDFFLGE
ncbi:SDR family oxidoreductase [Janibacter alittae]|uniref:NAD(P)-dependent oxidoreductase n=1 Tax=Janibacter alittae TaxID=3115209 RepID=A0ABZ2MKJ2_9MICO